MKAFLAFALFLATYATVWGQQDPATAPRPPKLPAFAFQTTAGQPFTNAQLQSGWSTIVIFFDPFCDHCKKQAEWIKADLGRFQSVQWVWASTMQAGTIDEFANKYFPMALVHKGVRFHFVRDAKYAFDGYFGYSTVPTVLVFGADGKLRKTFIHEVAAQEILNALR